MKIFLTYLNNYKVPMALWILFGLINIIIGYLYQVPLERSLLWLAICGFIGIAAAAFHFYNYYKSHKELTFHQRQTHVEIEQLPPPANLIENDYQALLEKLNAAFSELENTKTQNEQEILDYFTMWVHQIKIPISALHLILQDEDNDEVSEEMKEQLFKIEQYVELILQYVRLGSASTDYHFQKVDLDVIVCETIKKYASIFIRKKLPVHYERINQRIITDSKWLSFVLEQILSNALKYTNEGSISIYLEENAIVIEDTGIGIQPEDIPRVGERNFTGFTGRRHKSASGIGLHLSKQILAKLGHRIKIESEPKKGTKVFIVFDPKQITTK
ncbi:sensor histidine kinase [Oceanobacillus neutriphilus]|uniref:histidine kinase n=1 Tax=Oceanobacillus neutriphilus TaxID=531815 RepID=A0ABQ2NU69_9BACI|nr:sensor histidine kinase [Oceanobacillus neutriphilus]GGP10637.1 sensor histidine kinase [Oceanobacillus neutriphilus]